MNFWRAVRVVSVVIEIKERFAKRKNPPSQDNKIAQK
jgi:hypothetical protein